MWDDGFHPQDAGQSEYKKDWLEIPSSTTRALDLSALKKYGGISSVRPAAPFPLTLLMALCKSGIVIFG